MGPYDNIDEAPSQSDYMDDQNFKLHQSSMLLYIYTLSLHLCGDECACCERLWVEKVYYEYNGATKISFLHFVERRVSCAFFLDSPLLFLLVESPG